MSFKYEKLFTPVKIGSCEIKNRFAMAPMGPLDWLTRKAASTRGGSITIRNGRKAGQVLS